MTLRKPFLLCKYPLIFLCRFYFCDANIKISEQAFYWSLQREPVNFAIRSLLFLDFETLRFWGARADSFLMSAIFVYVLEMHCLDEFIFSSLFSISWTNPLLNVRFPYSWLELIVRLLSYHSIWRKCSSEMISLFIFIPFLLLPVLSGTF